MESNYKFSNLEINVDDSSINIKTISPFSIHTINKQDFAGIHSGEEKVLLKNDWNYAFRLAGIGILLMIISFAIGYNISGGATDGIGLVFVYIGVAFAQLITLGAIIMFLTFWDAFFGTQIAHKLLLKLFGKIHLKVIIASKQNDNLEFYLNPLTDKQNLERLMEINKSFK